MRSKRLNAVDLMLVLLLTLSLLSCIFRFLQVNVESARDERSLWRVVVHFENVDAALADCYHVGESAGSSPDVRNGVISSVEIGKSLQTLVSNGALYEAEWDRERRCTLTVAFDVRASEAAGVLYLEGRYAKAVSDELTICTDRTKMTGKIYRYAPLQA